MPHKAKHPSPMRPLPGDRPHDETVEEMIRVDHAGEYGAARIYAGQLAVLGHHHRLSPLIRHMEEQEARHLARFDAILTERQVRPSLLSPFWHVAGFALGAGTALMGERALMACTAAVEEVIEDHYEQQRTTLGESEPELAATIADFQAEEAEHRETAIAHGAKDTPGYGLLASAIKTGCRAAIALAKKI
ncbi:2-nonaprenyl-3-methyl-6-methoxy-1,4-benzoquinol hydroxylase [Iodidimonas gelatinilytica]|uniref:3-demethoxyubiquinol 3-hydroxylase n=2 Tax=Iodidimonas gelatinilytica TaxID=1236966 RepID=A0A5A7MU02_9PROT|nr:demethoxyubiquinone hydroxylase family protein [Iodidimonas gelatinilytica]GEQ99502.1 2-nonaprenyl-3-methyl-6-methoxy-1,4-benzoquinol hydroxylase [Iodidimonas gelatinilytica]